MHITRKLLISISYIDAHTKIFFERKNGEGGNETENSGVACARIVARSLVFPLMFSLVLSSPASILFLSVCLLGHGPHIYVHTRGNGIARKRKPSPFPLFVYRWFRYKYRLKIGNIVDEFVFVFLTGKSQIFLAFFLSLSLSCCTR